MAEEIILDRKKRIEVAPGPSTLYDHHCNPIEPKCNGRCRVDSPEGAETYFTERFRQFTKE